jgi:hypothetical protein
MIEFSCVECGRKILVKDSAAGEARRCPRCRTFQVVPSASGLPAEAAGGKDDLFPELSGYEGAPAEQPAESMPPRGARSMSLFRAHLPLLVLVAICLAALPLVGWALHAALRDTWEADNYQKIINLEAKAYGHAERGQYQAAIQTYEMMVSTVGQRELEDPTLKAAIKRARGEIKRLARTIADGYLNEHRGEILRAARAGATMEAAGRLAEAVAHMNEALALIDKSPYIRGELKRLRDDTAARAATLTKQIAGSDALLKEIHTAENAIRQRETRQHQIVQYMSRSDPFFRKLMRMQDVTGEKIELGVYEAAVADLSRTGKAVRNPPSHSAQAQWITRAVPQLVKGHTSALTYWKEAEAGARRVQLLKSRDDCWRYAAMDAEQLTAAWRRLHEQFLIESMDIYCSKLACLQLRIKAVGLRAGNEIGHEQYMQAAGYEQYERTVEGLAGDIRQLEAMRSIPAAAKAGISGETLHRAKGLYLSSKRALDAWSAAGRKQVTPPDSVRTQLTALGTECGDFLTYWGNLRREKGKRPAPRP